MRISSIELSGFRAFAEPCVLSLDADVVIIVGANGQGKTSLLDGILWALCGRIPRLGLDSQSVVSRYSSSGQARVTVGFQAEGRSVFRVSRVFDGEEQRVRLESNGSTISGEEAQLQLTRQFWPEALSTSDAALALTSAITRSVYLQQDLVREFVEADADQQRFNVVSELIGTGRISELQSQLDRGRAGWTRATNARGVDLSVLEAQLSRLEGELANLRPISTPIEDVEREWMAWWRQAVELGLEENGAGEFRSSNSGRMLEAGSRQLRALARVVEGRLDMARVLLADIERHREPGVEDERGLRARLEEANRAVEGARARLVAAREAEAQRLREEARVRTGREARARD